jgi:hypothetical protein
LEIRHFGKFDCDGRRLTNMPDWTSEECERLVQLVKTGASVARASVVLRRNMKSVRYQARKLGIPFPTLHAMKRLRQARFDAAARTDPARTP